MDSSTGVSRMPSFPSSTAALGRSLIALALLSLACARHTPEGDTHAGHAATTSGTAAAGTASSGTTASGATAAAAASDASLPAGAATVADRLAKSPRHGEYAMIKTGPSDSVRAWVVYPERSTKAPVVVVVHEIFGLSAWVRGVADQLAADGFIAIAPDLLTGKVAPAPGADTVAGNVATAAIRSLASADVQRQLAAVGQYGMALPAAAKSYGVVGFCWGGSASFSSAVASPAGQGAAVVYYGSAPELPTLASIKVPVLGLYGGEDARIGATVPPTDSAMKALGKSFEHHTFPGAGHGFLRQQDGQGGANLAAARQAWPRTLAFFRTNLGR
jgi:carboxymethylenebutenolidase